jgi:Ca2+-binding RTX toxin-like protein
MSSRTLGAATASAIIGVLLAATLAAPAEGARREDTCFGATPTIVADPADAVTYGTEEDNVILGGQRVEGLGGDDLICDARVVLGGTGDDRIRMTNGGTAYGNLGDDEFISINTDASAAGATLGGGGGNDVFWGGVAADVVFGGNGADVVRSGGGNDQVDLGGGNDQGYGGPGLDRFVGGTGDDYVDGGSGIDTVDGGPNRDSCLAVENRTSCRRAR